MPFLKRKRVLCAKVETTIGTAETLTASEGAFNAWDVMVQPSIEMTEREAQANFGYLAAVPGQYTGKITFKTDLGWDGTTTEPTWASVLLPACGWVSSGTDPTIFDPKTEAPGSNVKTLTMGCYQDGQLKKLTGCAGTAKIVLPTGKLGYIEWEFSGVFSTPTDVSIVSPTYPTASPLRFASAAALSYNSVSMAQLAQVTIDLGNTIVPREDATTAAGILNYMITNRRPKITVDPESVLAATQDRFAAWLASTEAALSISLDAPTTSTLVFSAPKAQILNNQEGDRSGLVIDQLEFGCNKNGTTNDQELRMTFTAAA